MVSSSGLTSMINTRGRVIQVLNNDVPQRKSEGWKVVVNPRRDYYPEYDQSNKNIVPDTLTELNEEEGGIDMLPYELV